MTHWLQGPEHKSGSPIKVSNDRIGLKVTDFLAIWRIVETFETGGTEKTRLLACQGIVHCHPSEISNESKWQELVQMSLRVERFGAS